MERRSASKCYRILLIDDNPADTRLIQDFLRAGNSTVSVSVANDGVAAIEYLGQCKAFHRPAPDLILLDLDLPRKNGREVLVELKSDPALRHIPVIVMTGSPDDADVAQAYDLQANCCIRKPSDLLKYEKVVRAIEDFWLTTVTLPESDAFAAPSPAPQGPPAG